MSNTCEEENSNVQCPFEMMQSLRNLALTGFELELFRRFDFVYDEHDVVYVRFESNENDEFIKIRSAAFESILWFMGLSEGIRLDDDEVDELSTKIEDFIRKDGDLLKREDIVAMVKKVA